MSNPIQDLDRLFADHFRVKPLIASERIPKHQESARMSSSSLNSSIDSQEAITPTYPPCIDLPAAPQDFLDDPIRALKLRELYQNIAELYIDKNANKQEAPQQVAESIPIVFARSRQPSARTITLHDDSATIYHDDEGNNEHTPELSPSSTKDMQLDQETPLTQIVPPSQDEDIPDSRTPTDVGLGLHHARNNSLKLDLTSKDVEFDPSRFNNKGKQVERNSSPAARDDIRAVQKAQESEDKRILLPLEEITFKMVQLPDDGISKTDAKDLLDKSFPHLCEIPTRMVGENGELLPPTKKEETSMEERQARKEALVLHFRGKKTHSLIKSVVILESRSASWKRVGSAKRPEIANRPLPTIPDPWGLECYHQDLDKLAHDGKAKRAFELKASRTEGLCTTCHGKGVDTCSTCKGEEADECWWCSGTGRKKNLRACERCVGEGKLKCQACSGKLVRPCEPCKGEGHGTFAAMVSIKVRRVDLPPVPTSIVMFGGDAQDPQAVQQAAVERTKEMIDRLIATNDARGKTAFRPLIASCSWELSSSSLLEVEVWQSNKPISRKANSHHMGLGLRRQMSTNSLLKHKKNHSSTKFFMIPTDADLRVVEMSKEEFGEALLPEIPRVRNGYGEAYDFSHSNQLPETNGGAMTPVAQAFRRLAAPSIQNSSAPSTPRMTPLMTPDHEPNSYFDTAPGRPSRSELRGHRRSGSAPRKVFPPGQTGIHF